MADMAKLNEDTKAVIKQLELLGIVNLNASKQMGFFEKQKVKVSQAIKKSPIFGMVKTLTGYAQSVGKVTEDNRTKCNDDQRAKRRTS